MPQRRKPRPKRKPPKMYAAIHRIRLATRLSQQQFAARLHCAEMTLSKWERGIHQPRDPEVLRRLRDLADDAGLAAERKMFEDLVGPRPPFPEGIEDKSRDQRILAAAEAGHDTLAVRLGSVAEWIDVFALRALSYLGGADLAQAREFVKEIIREEAPADQPLTNTFYNHLALRMDILTARKAFPHKFDTKENEQ